MLKAINLHKKYDNHTALHSLNIALTEGEIYALLGQNGAGKSTTINIFLGFVKPTSGEVFINGRSVTEHPQLIKKDIAYIPETVMLYPELTGIENLDFFSQIAGFSYTQKELIDFLILTGLQEAAHYRKLKEYSNLTI